MAVATTSYPVLYSRLRNFQDLRLETRRERPLSIGHIQKSARKTAEQRSSQHREIADTPLPERAAIRRSPLFQGLLTKELEIILRSARARTYAANSVVAEQGNAADRLFLLVNGSARYFFVTPEGQQVYLFWLLPGDIFGGTTLLTDPSQFIVSTEMATEGMVLVWQRDAIRHLAAQYPRLLENGLSIACDYLVWYLATHLSLVCHTARERLAHVLVSLANGIGRLTSGGIDLEITNEQLANTANLTPFTVSRLINAWQREGVLSKSRGRIRLHDPEGLYRISHGS